jgi:hypothetical protein
MSVLLAALLLAAADGLPLGVLPKQDLAAGECGIFLWKQGEDAHLLLMAKGKPPFARVMLDGKPADIPRVSGESENQGHARYAGAGVTLDLDVTIEPRDGLTQGAMIPSGTLRLDQAGGDSYVVPVAGMLACR